MSKSISLEDHKQRINKALCLDILGHGHVTYNPKEITWHGEVWNPYDNIEQAELCLLAWCDKSDDRRISCSYRETVWTATVHIKDIRCMSYEGSKQSEVICEALLEMLRNEALSKRIKSEKPVGR